MKYQVICSDPPYGFSDRLTMSDVKRGAEANYSTMTIQQIKDMRVKDLADPNGCVLALWVPSSLLSEGLDIMNTWGFQFKQTYIWNKTKLDAFTKLKDQIKLAINKKYISEGTHVLSYNDIYNTIDSFNLSEILSFGMGRLFRQSHEICLIGINNTKIYKQLKNKSQRSVSFARNIRHSQKPENLQNSLELMFPNNCNYLEIFSRRQRPNWTCIGNGIDGRDINDSIAELIGK